jgi:ketosteroid isomerase-like protein
MIKNFIGLLAGIILIASCSSSSTKTDVSNANTNSDSTAAVNAINKADSLWDDQSAHNSVQGWLSFYTDDAIMMPPGEKTCTDKASREVSIKNLFNTPGANMRFQATKTEVSKAGDLGYSSGVYQFGYIDTKGNNATETGKFCETWKKQADGSWKCIVDIWNADPAK